MGVREIVDIKTLPDLHILEYTDELQNLFSYAIFSQRTSRLLLQPSLDATSTHTLNHLSHLSHYEGYSYCC